MKAFFLATLGGARALDLEGTIGNLQPGCEADFVVLDPNATPLMKYRNARSESIEETMFVLTIMGDDRAVRATYIAGDLAYDRTLQRRKGEQLSEHRQLCAVVRGGLTRG